MTQHFTKYAVAAFALCVASVAQAQTVEQFYHGRTMTLIVPTSPGGINDISGRLIARHLGNFLPGNPNIVVQNTPGGGGLVAANRLANTAERDGSVVALIERATPLVAIQGDPNAKFDPLKLSWIGSLSSFQDDAYLVVVNDQHPAKTGFDLVGKNMKLTLGGNQPGSTNLAFAYIAKNALGLNIDVVRGYPGAAPMFLAMQRGELDGQIIGYNSIRAGQPNLWNDKKVRPIVQFGRKTRLAAMPDVPTGRELTKDPKMIALLDFAEIPFYMALPFVAPPELPADRKAALRKAFMEMAADNAFLADAEKVNLEISAITGEAVEKLLQQAAATPRDVIDLYSKLASPPSN